MGTHARFAPSAADRWIKCPASVLGYDPDAEDTDNDYAAEGTFAHELAARALKSTDNAADYIGEVSECGRFTVDEEFAAHLQVYIDAVRGTIELEEPDLVMIEERVHMTSDCHGTADAILWCGNTLHIFDLKFGAGVWVGVVDNAQAMVYALCALAEHTLRALQTRHVFIHIVQPRHTGRAWRSQHWIRGDLHRWRREVLEVAIMRAKADTPAIVAGDHCRWCPHQATCPELRHAVQRRARAVFSGGEMLPPADLSPDETAEILTVLPMIEAWCSAVRSHAYDMMERKRIPIPGFKLVQKTGHRKWTDDNAAEAALRMHGIDPFVRKEPVLCSPAEAERRLGKRKRLVDGLTFKPKTGTALKREDEKGEALPLGSPFEIEEE